MTKLSQETMIYAWHITQMSQAFELSRDTVRKRLNLAQVKPVKIEKGVSLYNLAQAAQAVFVPKEHAQNTDEMHPKDRKDYFQSENERLKYEKEVRQLIPIHEVAKEFSRVVKLLIKTLEILPDELEERCGLSIGEQDKVIELTYELREQLYAELIEPPIIKEETDECQPQPVPEP